MRLAEAFSSQRAAFETAYETDRWDGLDPFFHDDVVYEVMNVPYHCVVEGRANMVAAFRRSVERFDRKCARSFGPGRRFYEEGSNFLVHGSIEYRRGEGPAIRLGLWEIATFRDGRIARLTDLYDPGSRERVEEWMAKWGAGLDPAYV
jgi:ketosteroid isomerase-like protein